MRDPRRLSSAELSRELQHLRHAVACRVGRSNRPISGSTLKQYERDLAKVERESLRRQSAVLPSGEPRVERVGGTTFRLPALPSEDNDVVRTLQAQQDALLDAARAVRPTKVGWRPPSHRPPKPGTGTFTPGAGEVGSTVTVTGRFDGEDAPLEQRTGLVVMLAPGTDGRWVSFWDGQMPRLVNLDRHDKTRGSLSDGQAEYLRNKFLAKTRGAA